MSWYETAFGAHYRWLYAHRDDDEAARCVQTLAGRTDLGRGPVLDLACGAGRHLTRLAARCPAGVVGSDLSTALLDEARGRAGETLGLVRADMRALPFGDAAFTTVVSLFTAFGYFGALADHAPMLSGLVRVLAPGGDWCLDYLNCAAVRRAVAAAPAPLDRTVGPCRVRETKTLPPAGDRILKRVEIRPAPGREADATALGVPAGGLDYTESVALFDVADLDRLAAASGLSRVDAWGGYDGRVLDPDTAERWLLLYRRDSA